MGIQESLHRPELRKDFLALHHDVQRSGCVFGRLGSCSMVKTMNGIQNVPLNTPLEKLVAIFRVVIRLRPEKTRKSNLRGVPVLFKKSSRVTGLPPLNASELHLF